MTEHAEDPVGHASNKIVQYASLATMAAEALAQRAQHKAALAAASDERSTAALRAQQTGARNAARLQWQPVLDPRRAADLPLAGAGLAWASSQTWREVDPEAALANERALQRMRELRPDVMARFDRLTADNSEHLDQVEAMRRVAPFFDRPAAREHSGALRPELMGSGPEVALQSAADSAARAAAQQSALYTGRTAVVDDAATPHLDERLAADALARPHLTDATALESRAAALQSAANRSADRSDSVVLTPTDRTAPERAADAYPEPLTGQVLAAGRVKPKTPDRTAPAAVRSTGLATAARAAKSAGGRGR